MIHRYIIEATDEVKGFEETIERLDREWGIEELEPCEDVVSRQTVKEQMVKYGFYAPDMTVTEFVEDCLPPVTTHSKMNITVIEYDGVEHHIACESFEFRTNQVENWIRIDGSKEIHGVATIKAAESENKE